MNYPILEEHYGIDEVHEWEKPTTRLSGLGYDDSLHVVLDDEDMEVYLEIVEKLKNLSAESEYDDKLLALRNVGYLLSNETRYDTKIPADEDFANTLIAVYRNGEKNEYSINNHLKKVQDLIG
jgi:hypothetical protein